MEDNARHFSVTKKMTKDVKQKMCGHPKRWAELRGLTRMRSSPYIAISVINNLTNITYSRLFIYLLIIIFYY